MPGSKIEYMGNVERGEQGLNLATATDEEIRNIRGNEISMIFQEPMTSLNPVFTIGYQLDEVMFIHYPEKNKSEAKAHHEAEAKAAAEELAAKIKGQIVSVKVKGGASGKLHGKVTAKEVAEQLYKLTGTEIDKKKIEMPASIKEFGSYDAKVRLHVGVVAAFKVKVEEAPL